MTTPRNKTFIASFDGDGWTITNRTDGTDVLRIIPENGPDLDCPVAYEILDTELDHLIDILCAIRSSNTPHSHSETIRQ